MKSIVDTTAGTITVEDDDGTSFTVSMETYDLERRLMSGQQDYLTAIDDAFLRIMHKNLAKRRERLDKEHERRMDNAKTERGA